MNRIRVGVFFGGRSPEHWVSFKSGLYVLLHLDRSLFDVSAVYVTEEGRFASGHHFLGVMNRFLENHAIRLFRDSDPVADWHSVLESTACSESATALSALQRGRWDLVFPTFHGRYGEDGTFQGLARALGVPYAGCDFRASALGMDKLLTKKIAAAQGLAVAPYVEVQRDQWHSDPEQWKTLLPDQLGLPVFVKPARLGSSIGVGRARDVIELSRALDQAFEFDYRVVVESEIRGTEYAVGVLGDGVSNQSSVIAEYTSRPEAFDYDTKYGPQSLEDIIPANLAPEETRTLREFSQKVFVALGMSGISRIDSFWGPTGPILNEVNTLPGLNPFSPFIQAWEKAGVPPRQLLTRIVLLAWEGRRHAP